MAHLWTLAQCLRRVRRGRASIDSRWSSSLSGRNGKQVQNRNICRRMLLGCRISFSRGRRRGRCDRGIRGRRGSNAKVASGLQRQDGARRSRAGRVRPRGGIVRATGGSLLADSRPDDAQPARPRRRDSIPLQKFFFLLLPARVSFEQLVEVFWQIHDPTTLNRQGPDVGTQYRSIIFYSDDHERSAAEESKRRLDESGNLGRPIVTQIVPAAEFYRAEENHQRYFERMGIAPSCGIRARSD